MSRILIESRPVDVVGIDSKFRHVYLVFQADDGTETVITGGPQHDNPFDFGDIVVDAGGLLANSDVARGNDTPADRGSREIDVGARDPADVWAVMLQQAHNIDHAHEDYQPFSDNSNAVATTVLHAVGIDIENVLPGHVDAGNAPGLSEEIKFDTTLVGTARPDILFGWSGDDTLQGAAGDDQIRGFGGSDVIRGGDGDDHLYGGAGADDLRGGPGADTISGQAGADVIYGGPGDDRLSGGDGADELIGGPGADTMDGGAGSDRFSYQSIADGHDQILDFQTGSGGDVLDVSDLLTGFDPASSNPDDFVSVTSQGDDTKVDVKPDGQDSDAVSLVTLAGVTDVTVDQLVAHGNLEVSAPTS